MMAKQILLLALVLPVQALYHRAPKPETGYLLPTGGVYCMQGDPAYLEEVLQRYQSSNEQLGWKDSLVTKGTCADQGYKTPEPNMCFPKATVWFDTKPEHAKWWTMEADLQATYKKAHPELSVPAMAKLNVQCLQDEKVLDKFGKILSKLGEMAKKPDKLAALSVQALNHRAPKPETGYLLPTGGVYCMQGDPAYLEEVLQRYQSSNLQLGWKDSLVTKGTCADQGYKKTEPNMCFPKAPVWFDTKPEHAKWWTLDADLQATYKKAHPELSAPAMAKLNVQCMQDEKVLANFGKILSKLGDMAKGAEKEGKLAKKD